MIAKLVRHRIHYGWIVAAITFLMLVTAAGVRSTPGVLIIPLEHEFGWDRATISLAVSINLFMYGLFGPFAAAFMDRFGMRRVIVISLLAVGLAIVLTTFMHAIWQLVLLWGIVVGLGTGTTATVLGAIVANRWFVERRGLVMGVLSATTASGQLIFLPLLASLTVTYGWRAAALTTAAAIFLLVPIVSLLMRNRPADIGLKPYGATAKSEEIIDST